MIWMLWAVVGCCFPLNQTFGWQTSRKSQEVDRPNILFIFADDLAYDAVGYSGNSEVKTPTIDALAASGTRFGNAYNMGAWGGAVCMASRKMLNTGYFLNRAESAKLAPIVSEKKMWSQRMQSAGYQTFFTGKWHVGVKPNQIFNKSVHVRGGMPNQTPSGYHRPVEGQVDKWSPYDRSKNGFWKGGKHWSEVVADDAVEFLDGQTDPKKPFFMYVAFNAPHDPRQAPKSYVDQYPLDQISVPKNFLPEYPYHKQIGCSPKLRDEKLAPFPRTHFAIKTHRQEYYSIITHMDDQIGRILETLKKKGLDKNTMIVFTADHGLAVGQHGFLGKQNMYQHSVRVPFIVSGPGVSSKQVDTPIYLQDVMPTSLEWAGAGSQKDVDFKSLRGLLAGTTGQHHPYITGRYMKHQRMVVSQGHKLIHYQDGDVYRLYNLANDPLEMKDLAKKDGQKGLIESLKSKLPGWGVPRAPKKKKRNKKRAAR